MVETVAIAAASLFIVGLIVGLMTTVSLSRSIDRPPATPTTQPYSSNRRRR
jgi:hypothetical protein